MKLSQIAAAADNRVWAPREGNRGALKRPGPDALGLAGGPTHVIAGAAWSGVAMLEFPVFSRSLSIVVS